MQQSRPGQVISHSQVAAAPMSENANGGYESFPFHNTIEVKGRNRGKLCFLFYLSCIICFFYHRFFGTDWKAANALEFVAVFCELFFAYLWVQNQTMTWFFTLRYTDPERLCRMYCYGYANLPPVDIFITTMDPWKEPPLILVNTILSVLSIDYPFEKICCYVSDDGGSPLNFYAVLKAYEFAEKWVPFCKRFNIEPRAPMVYFSRPALNESESSVRFNGEWEELKQEYEKVKLDISRAMESCGQVPTEVQEMFDQLSGKQTIEIGNHPGLIKSFDQWVDLPRLIYVSREKRPGWKHHYKAGALNCLARVSGVITNSLFILNLDCDMYVNNSKALLHAAIPISTTIGKLMHPDMQGE